MCCQKEFDRIGGAVSLAMFHFLRKVVPALSAGKCVGKLQLGLAMKKNPSYTRKHRAKQVASTVSAAALMLGISHAATVAMHFQVNYCGYAGYTGLVVTTNAFGVPASGWQNLTPMNSGYTSCPFSGPPYGYTLSQTVSTNTSTGGLNPLPSGTI